MFLRNFFRAGKPAKSSKRQFLKQPVHLVQTLGHYNSITPVMSFHSSSSLRTNVDPFWTEAAATTLKTIAPTVQVFTAAWVGFKFNELLQQRKDYREDLKELQKLSQAQQVKIDVFVNRLKIHETQHLLWLYSKIDEKEITFLKEKVNEIKDEIDYNARLLQQTNQIEQMVKSAKYIKQKNVINFINLLKTNLKLHHQQLKMMQGFCETILYRKQKSFGLALKAVDQWIKDIQAYQQMVNGAQEELATAVLVNAYNHKAKVHRALAGIDLEQLEMSQLELSQENYKKALELDAKNTVVLSSLGFLLNDMSAMVESLSEREAMLNQALTYHKHAKAEDSQDPNIHHGLGYSLYKLEKCRKEAGKVIDKNNLQKALDAFSFVEQKSPNARLYHDRGLTHLLMGDETQALEDFNKGLQLDEHHPLLRYERGCLLLKRGEIAMALRDLQQGRMVSIDIESLKMKYDIAISKANDLLAKQPFAESKMIQTTAEPVRLSQRSLWSSASTPIESDLTTFDIRKVAKQAAFEEALRNCAAYADKSKLHTKQPRLFISYAWGNTAHEKWVEQFAKELEMAGFLVLLDRWFDRKGKDLMAFVEKAMEKETDFIIVVGTCSYLEKYNRRTELEDVREPVVGIEGRLIAHIVGYSRIHSEKVIPIILEGPAEQALPAFLHPKLAADFWRGNRYNETLALIRDMHGIPNRDVEFIRIKNEFTELAKQIDRETPKELAEKYEKAMREKLTQQQLVISQKAQQHLADVTRSLRL